MTATLPKLTEREFMEQVTQLAELRGWSWAHFRPAQTAKGWRTPVSGPLGKGWPDLVLVRGGVEARLIFAELKNDLARTTPDQDRVLSILETLEGLYGGGLRLEVMVWHPRDWPVIEDVLK